ncbi:adenosylcobinamide-GDP ribazoletransferase [Psychrosphaera algicola]|uniref:Adenosylcobinamide-GDP ribazoletransferase n=1 Tax=Psychrosphaera algicola TaxID=3023714 RepID=A0ABT5FGT6_9GAMM|nr:adenosylcobinamide-GDP ribazoletransferase [Psychrosphaera sp. G1-22]MDC2890106.1 adenosylcobinamide-GDP ribazoletransferase [Psychrosphaera sp. G1-22]
MNSTSNSQMSKRQNLQQHWFYFRLSLVFLTRIPIVIKEQVNDNDINHTSAYFGFVGFVLAAILAIVSWPLLLILPPEIVVALSMAVSLMLTGAFHEDGLADTADGLGGGWTQEQKLNIMKDSRIGTYGSSALIIVLLLKYQLLVSLINVGFIEFVVALFTSHSVSRVIAVSLIGALPYVQLDQQSKTKPIAQELPSGAWRLLMCSLAIVGLILLFVLEVAITHVLLSIGVILALRLAFKKYMKSQLGGYTGDILGATQQVFEILVYVLLVVWLVG